MTRPGEALREALAKHLFAEFGWPTRAGAGRVDRDRYLTWGDGDNPAWLAAADRILAVLAAPVAGGALTELRARLWDERVATGGLGSRNSIYELGWNAGFGDASDALAAPVAGGLDVVAKLRKRRDELLAAEKRDASLKDWQMADRWRYMASGIEDVLALLAAPVAGGLDVLSAAIHASPMASCDTEQDDKDRRNGLVPWCERFAATLDAARSSSQPVAEEVCDCECHIAGSDESPDECDACTGMSEQERAASQPVAEEGDE